MADLRDIKNRERLNTGEKFQHQCVDLDGNPLPRVMPFAEVARAYNRANNTNMSAALAYSVWEIALKKLKKRVAEDPNLEKVLTELLAG
jgi:hypothetical protein